MSKMADLGSRMGVAVVGIPVVLALLWLGGIFLGVLMAAAGFIGVQEFYRMSEARGARPFKTAGAVTTGLLVVLAVRTPDPLSLAPIALGILIALTAGLFLAAIPTRWPNGTPSRDIGATIMGVMYVGIPLAFVPCLRDLPAQLHFVDSVRGFMQVPGQDVGPLTAWGTMSLVLLPLLVTWTGDGSAYFVGNAIGKNKLAPTVSPGKTVEGAVGGIAGSVLAASLVAYFWIAPYPEMGISIMTAALMGAVIGAASQMGDLVESMLKREAGVKDSGTFFPGHGGMLDRLDSLLWAFPTTWLLVWLTRFLG